MTATREIDVERNGHEAGDSKLAEIAALRDALKVECGGEFALQAACIKRRGFATGIFCRYVFHLTGRNRQQQDGSFYEIEDEIEAETGLSRHHLRKARKTLKDAGVLEEKRKGIPSKLYYRAKLPELTERVVVAPLLAIRGLAS